MKAIGVIPARYGSSRFPGKPLVKILGKTLIERVYNQAVNANLEKIIVATDDIRIMDEVISFGGNAVLTGEHPSGTDRIAEAVGNEECDIVVNIQGDEPLITPEIIDTAVSALKENDWAHVSTSASEIKDVHEIENPNIVKVVLALDFRAIYFSRSPIPFSRNGSPVYYKHIGIYGYRRDFLQTFVSLPRSPLEKSESLEQLRVIENGYNIHVSVTGYNPVGVDTPDDVNKVERILSGRNG